MKSNAQRRPLEEEPLKLRGALEYVLRDARNGRFVRRGKHHNVITAIGRSFALKQIIATPASTNLLSWLALGTGSGATASNSSSMGGYFSIKGGTDATTASTTGTDSACTFTLAVSWGATQTHSSSSAINEFALWNSNTTSASATMFNRLTTGTPINFATSNTLAITVTITN